MGSPGRYRSAQLFRSGHCETAGTAGVAIRTPESAASPRQYNRTLLREEQTRKEVRAMLFLVVLFEVFVVIVAILGAVFGIAAFFMRLIWRSEDQRAARSGRSYLDSEAERKFAAPRRASADRRQEDDEL